MRVALLLPVAVASGHNYERLTKACQNPANITDEVVVVSVAECEELCDARADCNALDTNGESCYLKSHCEGELSRGGCTGWCGYRQTQSQCSSASEVGFDYTGNDLSHHKAQDLDACCELCTASAECKFYTWSDNYQLCYFKDSDAGKNKRSGFTSAPRVGPAPGPVPSGASTWTVDLGSTTPFPHFWEESVGSGHAKLTLRGDWRSHLTRARRELGFKRSRFHGIFDDDFGISTSELGTDFTNLDGLVDFHQSLGMMPLFELSYMPKWLASDPSQTLFNYNAIVSPPTDFGKWGKLIGDMAQHLLDRYGEDVAKTMMFEIWNEPNGKQFWGGTQDQYHMLYKEAAYALANVSIGFQIGGPATNSCNDWIDNLINYAGQNDAKLDFITCHSYGYGGDDQKAGSMSLLNGFNSAKERAGGRPVAITEWSSSWNHDTPFHDEVGSAPFIVAVMAEAQGVVDHASYWTFSDVFEEGGGVSKNGTFTGGFGLLTLHGTPKPSYRAFQLLHDAGAKRLAAAEKSGGDCGNVGVLALRNGTSAQLFLYNRFLSGESGSACSVTVEIPGVSVGALAAATLTRIDAEHANPKGKWQEMGSPTTLTAAQNDELEAASALEWLSIASDAGAVVLSGTQITVQVPAHGLVVIDVPLGEVFAV